MMKRVLILGPSGSGKSTLGERLGRVLNIPVIHLDQHYWNPNWVDTPKDVWREKVKGLIQQDSWVMDGNYTSTLALRASVADTIIFIDIPRRLSYLRVFVRFLKFRGRARPDVTDNCPEKIDLEFLRYIWDYPLTRRPRILGFLEQLKLKKRVLILHGQRDIEEFILSVRKMSMH